MNITPAERFGRSVLGLAAITTAVVLLTGARCRFSSSVASARSVRAPGLAWMVHRPEPKLTVLQFQTIRRAAPRGRLRVTAVANAPAG